MKLTAQHLFNSRRWIPWRVFRAARFSWQHIKMVESLLKFGISGVLERKRTQSDFGWTRSYVECKYINAPSRSLSLSLNVCFFFLILGSKWQKHCEFRTCARRLFMLFPLPLWSENTGMAYTFLHGQMFLWPSLLATQPSMPCAR